MGLNSGEFIYLRSVGLNAGEFLSLRSVGLKACEFVSLDRFNTSGFLALDLFNASSTLVGLNASEFLFLGFRRGGIFVD